MHRAAFAEYRFTRGDGLERNVAMRGLGGGDDDGLDARIGDQ